MFLAGSSIRGKTRAFALTVLAVVMAGLLIAPGAGSAAPNSPQPARSYNGILSLANRQLDRNVAERRGNNVPRFNYGRGRIAPYSIGDAWCAAFATWVWGRNGFTDFLETDLLWISHSGDIVAIQVTDLTKWAKRTGHWSTRAKPGYLVAYGRTHIGIVEKADRTGRAVMSIEGNKSNGVNEVTIRMPDVTGYISPEVLTKPQVTKMGSLRPDL